MLENHHTYTSHHVPLRSRAILRLVFPCFSLGLVALGEALEEEEVSSERRHAVQLSCSQWHGRGCEGVGAFHIALIFSQHSQNATVLQH